MDNSLIEIRNANIEDLDICHTIESLSYGQEGASKKRIKNRIIEYPQGFYVITKNNNIVGFINSGCTDSDDLSDESIKDLINCTPEGENIIIFSIAIHPIHRGNGYSKILLNHFISFSKINHKKILLLCKEEMISFYKKFDFYLIRKSKSTHGGMDWFEMSRNADLK